MANHAYNLEELVLLTLLERHQGFGCLRWILGEGEDAPHPLLRFLVPGFLEQPHHRVLVDVLEYVGHGLLAVGSVEFVPVDRWADSARVGGYNVASHLDDSLVTDAVQSQKLVQQLL